MAVNGPCTEVTSQSLAPSPGRYKPPQLPSHNCTEVCNHTCFRMLASHKVRDSGHGDQDKCRGKRHKRIAEPCWFLLTSPQHGKELSIKGTSTPLPLVETDQQLAVTQQFDTMRFGPCVHSELRCAYPLSLFHTACMRWWTQRLQFRLLGQGLLTHLVTHAASHVGLHHSVRRHHHRSWRQHAGREDHGPTRHHVHGHASG